MGKGVLLLYIIFAFSSVFFFWVVSGRGGGLLGERVKRVGRRKELMNFRDEIALGICPSGWTEACQISTSAFGFETSLASTQIAMMCC